MEWIQVLFIIFGVGTIIWGMMTLTNKRIDDTNQKISEATNSTNQKISEAINNTNQKINEATNSTNKRIDSIENEISNHIRTDIKDLRTDINKLKESVYNIQRAIDTNTTKIDQVLSLLKPDK